MTQEYRLMDHMRTVYGTAENAYIPIVMDDDGKVTPLDPDGNAGRRLVAWLAEGNVPDPPDYIAPVDDAPTQNMQLADMAREHADAIDAAKNDPTNLATATADALRAMANILTGVAQ